MQIPPSNGSSNSLIIFGSLTGISFILVGGVVALAYTDGKNASTILPVLLGLVGPLILSIISLSRSIENGQKVDTSIQQNQQIHSLLELTAKQVSQQPTVVVVPTPPTTEETPHGPA